MKPPTQHLVILLLLTLVSGCASEPPRPSLDRQLSLATVAQVPQLLDQAGRAFTNQRLTTPAWDNAYQRYRRVLELDPGNPMAQEGLLRIVEQYLTWAIRNARAGNYSKAQHYLKLAKHVDSKHPNIPPVQTMIDRRHTKERKVFHLSSARLRQRLPESALFEKIAKALRTGSPLVTIRAPNDASGRWIYQQLNPLTDQRLEATLEIGTPPAVIIQ